MDPNFDVDHWRDMTRDREAEAAMPDWGALCANCGERLGDHTGKYDDCPDGRASFEPQRSSDGGQDVEG